MAIITTGNSFNPTDTVTSVELNNIANAATFDEPVDGTSLELKLDGKLGIKDAGVTTDKVLDASITIAKLSTGALALAYPVGSIYMNATDATDPGTLLGFGTWLPFGAGRVPVGIDATDDDFDVVGSGTNTNGTTGSKAHTLNTTEIPAHAHSVTSTGGGSYSSFGSQSIATYTGGTPPTFNTNSVGGGEAHNNLQPYIVVHMWTRTA